MAAYGSAEWAQKQFGGGYYKPPAQTQQPSYYQQYIEQMKAQQAAQARAQQEAQARAQQEARAQQQAQQQASERLYAQQQARAQQAARDAESRERAGAIQAMAQARAQEQAGKHAGLGRQFTRYPEQENKPAAGQLGIEPESWFSKWFTKGMGVDRLPQQTGLFLPAYGTPEWTQYMYGNRPASLSSVVTESPREREDRLEILREKRRGYQVGMPGIDGVVPPQVLADQTQNNFGYDYSGWGDYPYIPWDIGGGGGGGGGGYDYDKKANKMSGRSQAVNNWYQSMVQWSIGNK